MGLKFLQDIVNLDNIQFINSSGTNAGLINMDGNDLVISNSQGDVLLGDGSADVFIGDGTNNVDIRFEQSGSITADNSNATLTIGGTGNLVVEEPTINNPTFSGAFNLGSKLTLNTSNGYILFDYEPAGDTGEYTTEVPLLKVDHNGTEKTILSRISENGGIQLGHDDSILITAGDVGNEIKANWGATNENVVLASEAGFYALAFPNNSTTWSNRNIFRFYGGDGTAANNGLYIGDGSSTQFIDLDRNLKNIGAITATGDFNLTNGFYLAHNEGMRLGETGNASTSWTTLTSFTNGSNSAMKIKGGNYHHNIFFETTWNDFEYAKLSASYNGSDSSFYLYKSDSSGNTAATTTISTGTSTFAGDVVLSGTAPTLRIQDSRNLNNPDWDSVSLGNIEFYTSDTTSPGARVLAEIEAFSNNAAASGPNADLIFKTSAIADSSPQTRLTIGYEGTSTFTGNVTVGSNSLTAGSLDINGNADISGNLTISSTYPRIFLTDSNSNDDWSIINNDGKFGIYNDTDTSYALTIDGSNNVGIGTTSPSQGLHVVDAGAIVSEFESSDNPSSLIEVSNNAGVDAFFGVAGGNLVLKHDDYTANHFSMTSAGKVGIGTTSPETLLHLTTAMSSSPTTQLYLDVDGTNTNGGGGEIIFTTSASAGSPTSYNAKITGTRASGGTGGDSQLGFWTTLVSSSQNPQERMTITKEGNVGIGTTSPDSLLEISSSSATDFLKLTSGGGSATPVKLIFEKSGSEQGIIEYNRNGDLEIYNTDGDGGVMIDGSASAGGDLYVNNAGNVGIGTTSPGEKLEVDGNIAVSGTVDGRDIATDGTKLDTVATNADVTPSWVPSSDPSYLTSLPSHNHDDRYYTETESDARYAALSHNHAASAIVTGTLADGRISESSVTQHEAALTITEGQLPDDMPSDKVKQICTTHHNFFMNSSSTSADFFVPFNNLNESSNPTNAQYYNRMVAPYNGRIVKVVLHTTAAIGTSCQVLFWVATSAGVFAPSAAETVTGVNLNTANTSATATFSTNSTAQFSAEDVLGVSIIKSSSATANMQVTVVWEYTL
jgi:hypothetical protein